MVCVCCGSTEFVDRPILWQELIDTWRLSADEVAYINRQQGTACCRCESNMRSQALAAAMMDCAGYDGPFAAFVRTPTAQALSVLEINTAGTLTPFLRQLAQHTLCVYPDANMMALPYADARFDMVVHSDTLEHVPDPVRGLRECARVLRPGGYCAFTVPIVIGRLTASRRGAPPSYHGAATNPADCLVHTEYGVDAWTQVIAAGFRECRIRALEYPAALALVGVTGGPERALEMTAPKSRTAPVPRSSA